MLKWLFGGSSGNAGQTGPAPQHAASGDGNGAQPLPEVLQLTPETITAAVIEQMSTTEDPRLREIMAATIRHVHEMAREVNLTPSEWLAAIDFLTRVGQKCTPDRQEFILLSDTMGLSALVNLMHDKTALETATDTSLLGPFYRDNPPRYKAGEQIAQDTKAGEVVLYGKVTTADGKPIPNAEVGIWQTASDGLYDIQADPGGDMDCRGIFTTDADGNYLIRTVSPRDYSIPMDGPVGNLVEQQGRHGMRPAHIHFLISAPEYRELVTALYMSDSKYLASDVVFGSSSTDLIAWVKKDDPQSPIKGLPAVRYDFSLSRMSDADRKSGRVGADPASIGASA